MDSRRWQRIRALFDAAAALEPAARQAYLDEACADDEGLRREVLELLDAERRGGDPLAAAVGGVVRSAAGSQLEPGRRIGHYTVLDRLGSGGMGEVWVAEDRELGRRVALKVLSEWWTSDPDRLRRFRREARALAALSHPNIVTIHSVESADGLPFFTMELVEGESLDQLVPDGGFDLERFFDLAVPLARALATAHENGITHRDLKLANVMLSSRGELKVLDFGLAKVRSAAGSVAESQLLTQSGMVMGTVPYMSPEQVQGRPLDPRSDIFSLGVVLYELATGSRPFQGDSDAALITSILTQTPPPISAGGRRVPPRLAQIIDRCLQKDPADRYQQAATVAAELAELAVAVRRHPALSGGISRLAALVPRVSLRRLAWTVTALAVLLALALGLDFAALERRLTGSPTPPEIASLAVRPLDNLTGDEAQEYFADGMTEVLITELSKIGGLRVISRSSMMRYKDSELPPSEIAAELGVDAVVEGAVRRDGDSVGITAGLVHKASDSPIWSESFERDVRDLVGLQGEVARAIAGQIEATLTPEQQGRLADSRLVGPRAWEAYLRGRSHWGELALGPAMQAYQEAIELEPGFARAWAGLAEIRQMQGNIGAHPPKVVHPMAREAVDRALELDPDLAEAHAVRGWIALNFEWQWEVAAAEFGRARELAPNNVVAQNGWAYYLAAMGRFDEAVGAIERARDLDPLSPFGRVQLAEILYYAGRLERAKFELAEQFDPGFAPAYWIEDRVLEASGAAEDAVRIALHGARRNPFMQARLAALEEALDTAGRDGFWREMIAFYLSWPGEAIHAKVVAEFYSRLGEVDPALLWLERAYERRDPLAHLAVDPIWDPLRGDPRFAEMLARLKLPRPARDQAPE